MGLVIDFAEQMAAREIIVAGLEEALNEMANMCANEGQAVTYTNHIVEAFTNQTQMVLGMEDGYDWDDIDIGDPYMIFMGEIIEAGNEIMSEAIAEANDLEGNEGEDDEESGGWLSSIFDFFEGFFD